MFVQVQFNTCCRIVSFHLTSCSKVEKLSCARIKKTTAPLLFPVFNVYWLFSKTQVITQNTQLHNTLKTWKTQIVSKIDVSQPEGCSLQRVRTRGAGTTLWQAPRLKTKICEIKYPEENGSSSSMSEQYEMKCKERKIHPKKVATKQKNHLKKVAKKKKPPGESGNSSRSSTPASSNREKHRQLPRPRSPVEVQTVGTKNMILEAEIWKRGSGCWPICHVIDCSFTVHCICTNLIKWLMRSVNTVLKPMLLIWVWLSISQCKKKN